MILAMLLRTLSSGDELALTISLFAVILAIAFGAYLRFSKRELKNEEQLKQAKKWSWIIYFLAMLFFVITLIYYSIKINS